MNSLLSAAFSCLPVKLRHYYYYRLLRNIDFPEIVHIESTNICNANCIVCPRERLSRKTGIMDNDLYNKIVDECAKRKEVKELHLNGFGECLLDKSLIRKIVYAKKKGIKKTYFVTNASLLNESIAEGLISSNLDSLKISIYGFNKDAYEKIHQGLNFDTTTKNIFNLISLRKKMHSRKPQIKIQFLSLAENLETKNDYYKFWFDKIDPNCNDTIEDFLVHNWVNGRNYNRLENVAQRKSCGVPFLCIQILWNGDVSLCCYDFNGITRVGSVRVSSIHSIWNGELYKKIREIHNLGNFKETPFCDKCDQLRK